MFYSIDEGADIKGVPGFWAQCLRNHPVVGGLITEEDIAALQSLTNITCEYNEDMSQFTLTFFFDDNDFFTNKVIIIYIYMYHYLLSHLIIVFYLGIEKSVCCVS
jgi:hypothetical protein